MHGYLKKEITSVQIIMIKNENKLTMRFIRQHQSISIPGLDMKCISLKEHNYALIYILEPAKYTSMITTMHHIVQSYSTN